MLTLVASSTQHRFVKTVSHSSSELVYVVEQCDTEFNSGTPSIKHFQVMRSRFLSHSPSQLSRIEIESE